MSQLILSLIVVSKSVTFYLFNSNVRERSLFLFISRFRKFLWVMRHLPRIYEDISLFSVTPMHVFSSSCSLTKQPTFGDATTGVSAK